MDYLMFSNSNNSALYFIDAAPFYLPADKQTQLNEGFELVGVVYADSIASYFHE
jgi:hypothetical protein